MAKPRVSIRFKDFEGTGDNVPEALQRLVAAAEGGAPTIRAKVALLDVLDSVYHELARRYHPDRGGSKEAMQALSDFVERLRTRVNEIP
jgi:hypothetical protein